jgi:hypothetical protein
VDQFFRPGSTFEPIESLLFAATLHKRIKHQLKEFEAELQETEAARVEVILADGRRVEAHYFGFHNPSLIIVDGVDAEPGGESVRLLLATGAVQIAMYAELKGRPPIGFQGDGREEKPSP